MKAGLHPDPIYDILRYLICYLSIWTQRNTAVILSSLGRNVITGQGGSIGEDWWVINNEWGEFWTVRTYLPCSLYYEFYGNNNNNNNRLRPTPVSLPPLPPGCCYYNWMNPLNHPPSNYVTYWRLIASCSSSHFLNSSMIMTYRWRDRIAQALPMIREESWPLLQAGLDMYFDRMSAIMVGVRPQDALLCMR